MKQLYKCWGGVIVSIILMLAFFTVGCEVEGGDGSASYSITIADSIEHGSVSAAPTKAEAGASVTLTVTPDDGYELEAITVKDANSADVAVTQDTSDKSKYTFTMPKSNVAVSATFTESEPLPPASYTITVADSIENGSVSASLTSAAAGASITLTVTAAEGYELDTLSVKDAKNADVKVTKDTNDTSKYTFTMPESNVTVSATFDKPLPPVYNPTPLTLEALTAGTIVVDKPQEGMQYTKNGGAKIAMTETTTITVAVGDKVAFYGKGTSIKCYYSEHEEEIVVNNEGDEYSYTDTIQDNTAIAGGTAEVKVFGNILSLLDETDFATATEITAEYAFKCLFAENTKLKDASELILPATKLSKGCYDSLFIDCSSLTKGPALPARKLSEECYLSLFEGCSSLTTAPELPATKLADLCYCGMFEGCSSLTKAPELPATSLVKSCYASMFCDCTSLTTAPELPATTLAYNCYGNMFYSCSSLTTAPKLPATTLAEKCYQFMFEECDGLTVAPEIPATKVASKCCFNMFRNCSKLTTGPEILPATTLEEDCYDCMFFQCTSLTKAPKLPATTLANSCYGNMFNQCSSLTKAPDLPATKLVDYCYGSMFDQCSSLTKAPDLPATKLVDGCYSHMFFGCSSLTEVTCMATDISAEECTRCWLSDVSDTGTFTTPSSTGWSTGEDGIPNGWTRVDAN